jgi:hypothetical protein
LRGVLREVLDEQLERLLEVLLKEVAGISAQLLGLQGTSVGARDVGTFLDIAELIVAATARGGRFF